MNVGNEYSFHNNTGLSPVNIKIEKSKQVWLTLVDEENRTTKEPLFKFLIWLKKQIDSGNEQFSLYAQELILYKPTNQYQELIFILPEVFDQYYEQIGIAPKIIQMELKDALEINFAYTIMRDKKFIEVFPCLKFF